MRHYLSRAYEFLVRFRTWVVNIFAAILIVLPDMLDAPEILAVVPEEYHRYVFLAALVLNVWMRPRPAVMAHDPEAQISKAK